MISNTRLIGEFEVTVDAKGRLMIPTALKKQLPAEYNQFFKSYFTYLFDFLSKQNISAHKLKMGKGFAFVNFMNEQDRDSAMEKLNAGWQAASQDMYNASQGSGNAGAENHQNANSGNTGNADGEVTDVDFEEVKDEKK